MAKILVIDDNKNNLIAIKAVLEDLLPECEILTAKSGVEGINITKEKLPDVILLDIIMPIMDGFDVCKQLKSDKDLKHIPVILITAIKADTESRVKGLESGADAFYTKPIDTSELHAQVNAMLRLKKAEDELRKQKNKLEKLVYEKTKKLNNSNKDLKQALIKAEESDKLKSAFLANMSHELRTPLNAIIGFSDFISNSEHLEDEIKDFANYIFSAGNDLLITIEDIFDISLIETKEVKVIKENFSLNKILEEIHKTFFDNEKILSNQINLILNKKLEDGEDIIHTDETKLNKILKNLIENAFKFTHKGTIEFGYTVKVNKDTSCIQFYVKDTGIGIHKDKQSIIFERLRQVDDSHTRKFGGIGLGLHISKKLVEMLGGKIWVESEEDKVSTFYFTIPHNNYIKKTDDINLIQKKTKFDWKDKTILLVEDDTMF